MRLFLALFFILCLPAFLLHPIPAEAFHPEPVVQNEESQKSVFEIPRDEFGKVNPWVLLQPENLSVDRYFPRVLSFIPRHNIRLYLEAFLRHLLSY